ncbi:MAG: hypothetical protein RJA13_970 [Bacteroidota bacterium]|jgi:hypothetical protein
MGLVRELFDEVISLPNSEKTEFIDANTIATTTNLWYAVLNLFFQCIDCILIPGITYAFFLGEIQFGLLKWPIIFVGSFASIFSIGQFAYYFLFPTNKYIHPLKGRLLGETALGAFICSIFKIPLYSRIK